MEYILENEKLCLRVASKGAEMRSIRTKDGVEYLWNGDPAVWHECAPNLFPYIGRLWNKTYTMDGETHSMELHGFMRDMEMEPVFVGEDQLTLTFRDSEATWARYPRAFQAGITYALERNVIHITFQVKNTGDKTMYFAYGGHPGIRLPLAEGKRFEDYYLEFAESCAPTRMHVSASGLIAEPHTPYALEDGRRIYLRHGLFDNDAVILKDVSRSVTVRCDGDSRAVTVDFPQMPYVGFWHMAKMEAPYVCIEPWSSLPARQDVVECFEEKADLISLPAGESYENNWYITIHE